MSAMSIWRRSVSLALVGSLVAFPALAGGDGHGRGRGHGHHDRSYHGRPYHGGRVWRPVYWAPPRHHHHHHDGHLDAGDVLLVLGVTAVGLTAFSLWSQAQQQAYANAQYQAFGAPLGQPVVWNQGGAGGSVVALSEGYADSGEYCREFQKEIVVGGRRERGYGIACQQPDGSWRIGR